MNTNFKIVLSEEQIVVPDTGLPTFNEGVNGVFYGGIGTLILLIIAVMMAIIIRRKYRSQGVILNDDFSIHGKKNKIIGLFAFALLVGVFGVVLSKTNDEIIDVSAVDNNTLSLSVDDLTLAVVPDEEGSFAFVPHTITVTSATYAGYNLSAYASSFDMVNAENAESKISGLTNDTGEAAVLSSNTWGIALNAPEDKDSAVWYGLSDSSAEPTIIKSINNATGANDATTVYYGANVNTKLEYGEYDNVVNYMVTTNILAMQDATDAILAESMPNTGDSMVLIDARDRQEYTVAKLADGQYWMTKNLNLVGGTALSPEDTNFDASYVLPTTDGWTVEDGKLVLPASSTLGFSSNNYAYVYNSGNTDCGDDSPCYSYYSWDATTLGSGRGITTDGYNVESSICPKGWRLPTATTSNARADKNNNWKTGDMYALVTAYGADVEDDYFQREGSLFDTNAGPGTAPNFVPAGNYSSGSLVDSGTNGRYWTSTLNSGKYAYALRFYSGYVNPVNINYRRYGYSVRCLFNKGTD